jgi:hypothetical protein
MVDALRTLVIPAFGQRGFRVRPLTEDDARSAIIRSAFPLGRLRRVTPAGCEMVEIQFDKRRPTTFRLNVGIAPPGGIVHAIGPVAQDDIWVHHLPRYFEVYRWAPCRRWFSAAGWFRASIMKETCDAVAGGIVSLIPDIEAALAMGKVGRHVRRVTV